MSAWFTGLSHGEEGLLHDWTASSLKGEASVGILVGRAATLSEMCDIAKTPPVYNAAPMT